MVKKSGLIVMRQGWQN